MRLPLELLLSLLLLGLCNAHHGKASFLDSVSEDLGSGEEASEDTEDITTTILRLNNGSRDLLFEGDLMIPTTRSARKCLNRPDNCLWPKNRNGDVEVPYKLSEKYDDKSQIERAMRDLESETCIRFVPYRRQRGYLNIEPRFGCSSTVGYVGDRQKLSLQKGCLVFGIIQHELMHALGFFHEQSRSDRDRHIRINFENILNYKNNFEKHDTNNLGVPYDYSSVLHYGKTAFAKPGMESMTPIPNPNVEIGQRRRASPADFLKINRLYKCRMHLG
uniref:Metalloendopeptidase n=1 Tax=Salarias fasciatus TaxID=181472 RepID=A0A672JK62_SALFA